jgi:hypothetical protein
MGSGHDDFMPIQPFGWLCGLLPPLKNRYADGPQAASVI